MNEISFVPSSHNFDFLLSGFSYYTDRHAKPAPAASSARCIGRAGLDLFQFLHNGPERASNGLIVGAQLLRTSDYGRHYFKYRNNSLMVGIAFGAFRLASRSRMWSLIGALKASTRSRRGTSVTSLV